MNATLSEWLPVMSGAQARAFEEGLFKGNEAAEWPAMQRAGQGIGRAILRDFAELGDFPEHPRVIVLVGKGHNGGDALIAAQTLLQARPEAHLEVIFAFGERALRPLTHRAWRDLQQRAVPTRLEVRPPESPGRSGDVVIDGVFGFQFRPPLDDATRTLLTKVNARQMRFRAAVDLPSGLGEEGAFRADFTYATGVVKAPVVGLANAGRLRLIDLGWSFAEVDRVTAEEGILSPRVLAPLGGFRPAISDKRSFGHLFVMGGSRSYPGAVVMSVRAALHSGVGLLTAFVPESLAPAFAAVVPEAMWVGCPETPDGGLAMKGAHLLKERLARANAIVIGPGLARSRETLAWVKAVVGESSVPLVLDADALHPEIVRAGSAPRIVTPHAGELSRLRQGEPSGTHTFAFAGGAPTTLVAKGPVTKIVAPGQTYVSLAGGPVLARGGSGDLLAGMIGARLAQCPQNPVLAACQGVLWHGLAADALARALGSTAVTTTQLLEFLPPALCEAAVDCAPAVSP